MTPLRRIDPSTLVLGWAAWSIINDHAASGTAHLWQIASDGVVAYCGRRPRLGVGGPGGAVFYDSGTRASRCRRCATMPVYKFARGAAAFQPPERSGRRPRLTVVGQ